MAETQAGRTIAIGGLQDRNFSHWMWLASGGTVAQPDGEEPMRSHCIVARTSPCGRVGRRSLRFWKSSNQPESSTVCFTIESELISDSPVTEISQAIPLVILLVDTDSCIRNNERCHLVV